MSLGDALVLLGITVALLLYELERWWADRRDLKSALNVLSALRGDALVPYGDRHFDSYDAAAAHDRAQKDYDSVMVKSISDRVLGQVWQVPIEPLVTLIGHPGVGSGRIGSDTVRAAVMALRHQRLQPGRRPADGLQCPAPRRHQGSESAEAPDRDRGRRVQGVGDPSP